IQAKINADSGLQGKQLGVTAAGGVVTLTGTVDNDAQREAASRYAGSEPGVKQVFNNLTVAAPTPVQTAQAAPVHKERKPTPAANPRRQPRKPIDETPSEEPDQVAAVTPPPAPAVTPAPAPVPAPAPAAPPPPQKVTIPNGTALSVRLIDPIDSETNQL